MFYYLYKITNLVNNKIYVGVHKTKNLNDGYMGSGKIINSAIEKYGINNFKKDILETFENAEAMYAREKQIVNDEFLLREDVYNLRRGGRGGFDYLNKTQLNISGHHKTKHSRIEILNKYASSGGRASQLKHGLSDKFKEARKTSFLNKTHSKESKKKIGEKNSKHQTGTQNSQYGTMWINDGKQTKKILKTDILPEGWRKGRSLK